MKTKILITTLTGLLLLCVFIGCSSTPEESTTTALTQNDLLGRWETNNAFTYKDAGIAYGKASDALLFTKGPSENTLFLEVVLTITEASPDASDDFSVGTMHTIFLNKTGVTVLENSITLEAQSPYLSPSTFNFIFDEGVKTTFVWDGIEYTKK